MRGLFYLLMIYVGVGCESFGTAVNTNMAGNPSDTTKTQNWKELSPEQYKVCHDKATEAPFSGKYDNHYEKGIYYCAVCKTPLFNSETKFKSGTGWPSFYNEIDTNVSTHTDSSYNMIRDEIVCNKCGSHLGHVFNDGPAPTGMRYCVNSLSLDFKPSK